MARRPFRPEDHPRDRLGRFIEVGGRVSLFGGLFGIVRRNVGWGRVEVEREDGRRVIVAHGNVTMVSRPDGTDPVERESDKPAAAPVVAPSASAVEDDTVALGDEDLAAAEALGVSMPAPALRRPRKVGPNGWQGVVVRQGGERYVLTGVTDPTGAHIATAPDGSVVGIPADSRVTFDTPTVADMQSLDQYDDVVQIVGDSGTADGDPWTFDRYDAANDEVIVTDGNLDARKRVARTDVIAWDGSEGAADVAPDAKPVYPDVVTGESDPGTTGADMTDSITAADVRLSQTHPTIAGRKNRYRERWAEVDGRVYKVEADSLNGVWMVSDDDEVYAPGFRATPDEIRAYYDDVYWTRVAFNLTEARTLIAERANERRSEPLDSPAPVTVDDVDDVEPVGLEVADPEDHEPLVRPDVTGDPMNPDVAAVKTWSPKQIDVNTEQVWTAYRTARMEAASLLAGMRGKVEGGDERVGPDTRPRFSSKPDLRPYVMSDDEVIAAYKPERAWDDTPSNPKPRRDRAAEYRAALDTMATARAAEKVYNDEFMSRPWTRAFLVTSSGGGHVHKSMSCSTCNQQRMRADGTWSPGTEFIWLPEYAGEDETRIVGDAGERACTVCFPTAPVNVLNRTTRIFSPDERRKAEERASKEAAKAERAAKAAANAPTADGSPLVIQDGRYPETLRTERAAVTRWMDWADYTDISTFKADQAVEKWRMMEQIVGALAEKHGVTPAEKRAELIAKHRKNRKGYSPFTAEQAETGSMARTMFAPDTLGESQEPTPEQPFIGKRVLPREWRESLPMMLSAWLDDYEPEQRAWIYREMFAVTGTDPEYAEDWDKIREANPGLLPDAGDVEPEQADMGLFDGLAVDSPRPSGRRPALGDREWSRLADAAENRGDDDIASIYRAAFTAPEDAEVNWLSAHPGRTYESLTPEEHAEIDQWAEALVEWRGLTPDVDLDAWEAQRRDALPEWDGEEDLAVSLPPLDAADAVAGSARAAAGAGEEAEAEDNDIVPADTVFTFPAYRLDEAVKRIEAANRRAEKAGIPHRIGYTTTSEWVPVAPERNPDGSLANPGAPTEYVEEVTLTLDRPNVKHDGWTFVGTMTWDEEAGLVTRVAPGATLTKRPEARECDVCKSARDRKDTYIVQNDQGEQVQVGSNCLQQFMGISPKSLFMLAFDLSDISGGDGEERDGMSRGESRYDTVEYLAWVAAVVHENGWMPRSRAEAAHKPATVDLVATAMRGKSRDERERAWIARIQDDVANRMDEAVKIRDFARTLDGDSEYAENLRAVATADRVSERNMALLASAISSFARNNEQRAAAEASSSVHIGEVGGKVKDLPARVTATRVIEGNYGPKTLLTFTTTDGNVVKWWASGNHEWQIGDEVTIKSGTIKGHGAFNGIPETEITRAKVEARGATADAAKAEADQANAVISEARVVVPEGWTPAADWDTGEDPDRFRGLPIGARVRVAAGYAYVPTGRKVRGEMETEAVDIYKTYYVTASYRGGRYLGLAETPDGDPSGRFANIRHEEILAVEPGVKAVISDGTEVAIPAGWEGTNFRNMMSANAEVISDGTTVRITVGHVPAAPGSFGGGPDGDPVYGNVTLASSRWMIADRAKSAERPDGTYVTATWKEHGSPAAAMWIDGPRYNEPLPDDAPAPRAVTIAMETVVSPQPSYAESPSDKARRERGREVLVIRDAATGEVVREGSEYDRLWLPAQPVEGNPRPSYYDRVYTTDDGREVPWSDIVAFDPSTGGIPDPEPTPEPEPEPTPDEVTPDEPVVPVEPEAPEAPAQPERPTADVETAVRDWVGREVRVDWTMSARFGGGTRESTEGLLAGYDEEGRVRVVRPGETYSASAVRPDAVDKVTLLSDADPVEIPERPGSGPVDPNLGIRRLLASNARLIALDYPEDSPLPGQISDLIEQATFAPDVETRALILGRLRTLMVSDGIAERTNQWVGQAVRGMPPIADPEEREPEPQAPAERISALPADARDEALADLMGSRIVIEWMDEDNEPRSAVGYQVDVSKNPPGPQNRPDSIYVTTANYDAYWIKRDRITSVMGDAVSENDDVETFRNRDKAEEFGGERHMVTRKDIPWAKRNWAGRQVAVKERTSTGDNFKRNTYRTHYGTLIDSGDDGNVVVEARDGRRISVGFKRVESIEQQTTKRADDAIRAVKDIGWSPSSPVYDQSAVAPAQAIGWLLDQAAFTRNPEKRAQILARAQGIIDNASGVSDGLRSAFAAAVAALPKL